jgi:hypothetical protein
MGQCRGKTKKGDRCRREASESSRYCSTHRSPKDEGETGSSWGGELGDSAKTVFGLAVAAIVVCSYLVRGRF